MIQQLALIFEDNPDELDKLISEIAYMLDSGIAGNITVDKLLSAMRAAYEELE